MEGGSSPYCLECYIFNDCAKCTVAICDDCFAESPFCPICEITASPAERRRAKSRSAAFAAAISAPALSKEETAAAQAKADAAMTALLLEEDAAAAKKSKGKKKKGKPAMDAASSPAVHQPLPSLPLPLPPPTLPAYLLQPAATPMLPLPSPVLRDAASETLHIGELSLLPRRECAACLRLHTAAQLLVAVPCGHRCLCAPCAADGRKRCPACRGPLQAVVRIYDE